MTSEAASTIDVSAQESAEYQGYQPDVGVTLLTNRSCARNIEPLQFFNDAIKCRRPVIISNLTADDQWRVDTWTNDYLMKKAGSVPVYVEEFNKLDLNASDPHVEMSYKDFLSKISQGNSKYWLHYVDQQTTTNDVDVDPSQDLVSSILVEPLLSLTDDFPLRPSVIGNLVLHRVTISQGYCGTSSGLTSGLRHDFHDNFCLVLKGSKRFRLFPPTTASKLLSPTAGPYKVYPNGLIVQMSKYGKRQIAKVRADGAPFESVVRMKRDAADRSLTRAEKKLYSLRRSGTANRSKLEAAMDLVSECENVVEAANEELRQYDSDDDCYDSIDKKSDVISIHDDDSDPELTVAEPLAKIAKVMSSVDEQSDVVEPSAATAAEAESGSNVQLATNDTVDPMELFGGCRQLTDSRCIVARVEKGEMIFIPASWFYEVTTYDDEPVAIKNKVESSTGSVEAGCQEGNNANCQTNGSQESGSVEQSTAGGEDMCKLQLEQTNSTADTSGNTRQATVDATVASRNAVNDTGINGSTNTNSKDIDASTVIENVGHLSLTYLTYPPDSENFAQPYRDNTFWSKHWTEFVKEFQKFQRRNRLISSDVISLDSAASSDSNDSYDGSSDGEEPISNDEISTSFGQNDNYGNSTCDRHNRSSECDDSCPVTTSSGKLMNCDRSYDDYEDDGDDDVEHVDNSGPIVVADDSYVVSDNEEDEEYVDSCSDSSDVVLSTTTGTTDHATTWTGNRTSSATYDDCIEINQSSSNNVGGVCCIELNQSNDDYCNEIDDDTSDESSNAAAATAAAAGKTVFDECVESGELDDGDRVAGNATSQIADSFNMAANGSAVDPCTDDNVSFEPAADDL